MKLAAVMVAGAMSSLKTALTEVLVATPAVGPGIDVTGTVRTTLGRVLSGAAPVVNVQTKLPANATPLLSATPVVTVAVHVVLTGRLADGVKIATRLAAT